jgi:hypothetical protein
MKYFLQRDGTQYGPYSLDDLKRYQAENRIGPNDQVRSEDSQQWQPWKQVLDPAAAAPQAPDFGGFPPVPPAPQPSYQPPPQQPNPWETPPAQPQGFGGQPAGFGGQPQGFGGQPEGFGGQPQGFGGQQQGFGGEPQGFGGQPQGFGGQQQGFGAPSQPEPFPGGFGGAQPQGYGAPHQPQFGGGYGSGAAGPMPPDMQWYIVLLITLVCGFFGLYWFFKQASFVQKIDPQSKGKKMLIFGFIAIFAGYVLALLGMSPNLSEIALLGPVVILGAWVCILIGVFDMRKSIHNYYTTTEPMGINLMTTEGAVLTLFFSMYYFQYHFANIAARKKALGHQ